MQTTPLLLLLPCLHAFRMGPAAPHMTRADIRMAMKPKPLPAGTLATPASVARPLLVPALSYGGLALAALATSQAVAAAGYESMSYMGVSAPMAALAAVAAPAAWMLVELALFGGGERVGRMMGGMPADERLTELVRDVAVRAGLEPPAHVFEIPTSELNAFAAGFGTNDATVAVTSGLRNTLNRKELEAVIAHEIGHIRHSDMRTSMHVAVAIAGLGGIYELGNFLLRSESRSEAKDDDEEGGAAALGLAMMVGGLAARLGAQLLKLSVSRSAEFEADSVAAELCGSEAMISALKKIQGAADRPRGGGEEPEPALSSFRGGAFAHSYISNGAASEDPVEEQNRLGRWWQGVCTAFSTHPTTKSRIAALEEKFVLPPSRWP